MRQPPWLPGRYWAFALSVLGLFASSLMTLFVSASWMLPTVAFVVLVSIGTWDLLQTRRTVRRNYPLLAHLRYCLESIGPEIRQYFIESDTEERPFSREQRAVVYQRSKAQLDKKPFGSLLDCYEVGYEWMSHSLRPSVIESSDFRVEVGSDRRHPYRASVFNISAMSFGSLSAQAISALNRGAAKGGFYQDTGEGGVSQYHLAHGGDLVWEIGSGYFGCRNDAGEFDPDVFAAMAADDRVRMLEIKLSQGAKPGHGGILPASKVSAEIAAARGVLAGQDVVSPARHSAFSTPLELIDFVGRLRSLCGGKPVGIKLAIGHPAEWFAIVKAMLERDSVVDFIVVDGGEGGTGAAPLELINRMGMPVDDALHLVHSTLVGCGLRQRVKLAAAGKVTTAFKIARLMALGADWCNAGRGFMFALGCIQSLSCHTDRCPTGVATQDPLRGRALDVSDKGQRVANFHRNTLIALGGLLSSAGLEHPRELRPDHVIRRLSRDRYASYEELYPCLEHGELLQDHTRLSPFRQAWPRASASAFQV